MPLSEKHRTWLEAQITANAPPPDLAPGSIGRLIQELAGAVVAFERGGGQAFGLQLSDVTIAELAPLSERAKQLLGEWHARLSAEHGDEGADVVHTIAARMGVTLPTMKSRLAERAEDLPPGVVEMLARTRKAIADEAGRRAHLAAENGDDEVRVGIRTGTPNREALLAFCTRYEASTEKSLPLAYFAWLSEWNGLAVRYERTETVDPRELSEPNIWPLQTYGDHFMFEEADLPGVELAFVFGELADSGTLFFDAAAEDQAPVYWRGRREDPHRLADSFEAFIGALAANHFSLPSLLRACRVPGWGA